MAFAIIRTGGTTPPFAAPIFSACRYSMWVAEKRVGSGLPLPTSENADVDVRCLDFAEVCVLWVSIASTKLLEHYRSHIHGADGGGSSLSLVRQLRHHT